MTEPVGSLSLARSYLRNTIADCDTFRTWIGATTQEQARRRIFYDSLPAADRGLTLTRAELEAYRPHVLLFNVGYASERDSAGANFGADEGGAIVARFEQDVPAEIADNPAEITLRFENTVGQILDEIHDKSMTGGYLLVVRLTISQPTLRVPHKYIAKEGDYVQTDALALWGDLRLAALSMNP